MVRVGLPFSVAVAVLMGVPMIVAVLVPLGHRHADASCGHGRDHGQRAQPQVPGIPRCWRISACFATLSSYWLPRPWACATKRRSEGSSM